MRLKLYRAASVAEAMAQLRDDLGPEALILSTRRVADGVEITAGLDVAEAPTPAGPAHVSAGLAFHGMPAALAARLAGHDLASALRGALRFGPLPLARHGPPVLLAGMPGAGKTLTVARLATRLVLDGISPLVITADGRRAGAAEELAAYTRLLGIGLVVASTPATLARALGQRQLGMPVLIDTAGINPFAADELDDLRALAGMARAEPVLVMPAGQDPAEAEDQALAFTPLGTRHLLPTRFDLARRLGSVLGAAAAADLILTEAGIGPGATDGLASLTPEFLAERLGRSPDAACIAAPLPAAASPTPPGPLPWVPRKAAAPGGQTERTATRTGYSV
jgi:flagellar biosynthesis protein FlhF